MKENGLRAGDIRRVRAKVHGPAIDVLGPVADPRTVHQSKFSMGFVLALIAVKGSAGLDDFTVEALADPDLRAFRDKVEMALDEEVDDAYPVKWVGLVDIETIGGKTLTSRVDAPKGDPENTLDRGEIEEKFLRLAAYGGASDAVDELVEQAWSLDRLSDAHDFLKGG